MARAELPVAADGSAFDPAAVPMYPVLRAEIRDTEEGEYVGLVDDEVVASGLDLEPVRAAIVASAAAIASRRLGSMKAIRVRGKAPGGDVFAVVVTADGRMYDTTTGEAGATSSSTGRAGKSRRSIQTPDAGSGRFRVHPIVLVIFGFPVMMVIFLAWLLVSRHGASTPDAAVVPAPRQLPVVAPQGYSPVSRWAVKVGTASSTLSGGVTADAERVYAATGRGDHVTAYASSNGVRVWSSDLGSVLTAGPSLTTVNGKTVIAAATTSKLTTLDPATGARIGSWKFDQGLGSQVRITATGPVVIGQGNVAQIIVDGELVTRMMPAGALPVAPGPDGSLIAVTRDRVYASVSSTLSGPGRAINPVGGGQVVVAGWTGRLLVLVYASTSTPTAESGDRLAAYSAPDRVDGAWPRAWSVDVPASSGLTNTMGVTAGSELPLVTGPSGTWGVDGSTLITMRDGAIIPLGEWSTVCVGDQIAFGTGAEEVLSAGPSGIGGHSEIEPSSTQLVAPQAVAGSAAYLVAGVAGTSSWLYALAPSGASLSSSASVSAPAAASSDGHR